MCWSYQVSVTFTLTELVLIVFLFLRSRYGYFSPPDDPYVKRQYLVLPALISICLMEAIEAVLWSRPNELLPIQETAAAGSADSNSSCPKWNQRLTIFTWLFILPWQPLWVILPCRRVGHVDNRKLLQVPEFLAIVFACSSCFLYCISHYYFDNNDHVFSKVQSVQESRFKSYLHSETCTYLGLTGHHLHWAYSTADTILTPNAFTYILLWLSVGSARPKRFAAGIFLSTLALFFVQWAYFDFSWEAGSVWCWSAMIMFVYFTLQPYILPCPCRPEKTEKVIRQEEEESLEDEKTKHLLLPHSH